MNHDPICMISMKIPIEQFLGWITKSRIQPLQARETLGFQYRGTADSSRYSKEEISDDVAFSRVRLLKNVKKIPVVPDTFSAANPPKQVLDKSGRYVVIEYIIIV